MVDVNGARLDTIIWAVDALYAGIDPTGKSDSTIGLRSALSVAAGGSLYIPSGIYYIEGPLSPASNTTIVMDADTQIKATPNSQIDGSLFLLRNVSNVQIRGGQLIGDLGTFVGDIGGDWFALKIQGAQDCFIDGLVVKGCVNDGIHVSRYINTSERIIFSNVKSIENGRNGLSIIDGMDIQIIGGEYSRNSGLGQYNSGIDIEPYNGHTTQRIIINGVSFCDNADDGIAINGGDGIANDITITGCQAINNTGAGYKPNNASRVVLTNNIAQLNSGDGVLCGSDLYVTVIGNMIITNNAGNGITFNNNDMMLVVSDNVITGNKNGIGIADGRVGYDIKLNGNILFPNNQLAISIGNNCTGTLEDINNTKS